jgi:glutathione synthase/RimK-type ligase-like ATP-grasp enzyme
LTERGVPVPETIKLLSNRQDLFDYDFSTLPDTVVIKPNHGSKGNGIVIVKKTDKQVETNPQQNTLAKTIERVSNWLDQRIYQQIQ